MANVWSRPSSISLGPGGFRVPLVSAVASVAGHCFGPGGLHVPPVVADGSEPGHCFQILFWFSRTDHCIDKLAFDLLFNFFTTKTDFRVFFSFFLSTSSAFTHFRDTPEAEILFPQYFGITRRNIKKFIFILDLKSFY